MTKIDAALEWAGRGFRVFPLRPGTKRPFLKDWPSAATTDPAAICSYWEDEPEANIGVLTDNLIVVDIDVKNGRRGVESYKALDLPVDTLMVQTPSGGFHAYFTGPNVSLSVDQLGEGLDVRSYHGYVLAPGSEVDGGAYRVVHEAQPLPAPQTLVARLQATRERPRLRVVGSVDEPVDIERARAFLQSAAPAIEGHGGDAHTYSVICSVKDFGISEEAALELLLAGWNESCVPPWDVVELEVKIHNAYRYGTSPQGVGSLGAVLDGFDAGSLPYAPGDAGGAVESVTGLPWLDHGRHRVTEVAWLFHNILPARGTAFLTAPSGTGKTFLALELARCVAAGKPFFGVEPDDRGGVVFVFAGSEGSGLGPRLEALQEPDPLPLAFAGVMTLKGRDAIGALADSIRIKGIEMQAAFGVPIRLVVLETLSASGLVDDENNSSEMAAAVNALAQLSRDTGALVLTTHHPPKTGNGERGSGALRASADYMLQVEDDGFVKRLDLTKARDAETRSIGMFSLSTVVVGQDGRGRDITTRKVDMTSDMRQVARASVPKHADYFNEVYDLCDSSQLEDGTVAVELAELRSVFKERWKGASRDRSNIMKAFRDTLQWSLKVGAVRQVHEAGRDYIVKGKYDV